MVLFPKFFWYLCLICGVQEGETELYNNSKRLCFCGHLKAKEIEFVYR